MDLVNRLASLGHIDKIADNNYLHHYLPIRSKNNTIDYSTVAGNVLGLLIGKELDSSKYSPEVFKEECLLKLGSLLTDEDMLQHMEKIYFENNTLNKASPEFLLLGTEDKETSASKYLSAIFRSFLKQSPKNSILNSKANFIENIFIDVLQNYLRSPSGKKTTPNRTEQPYLPFMAENFTQDISFLSSKTEYLLEHFEDFLELYNFLYCSQLALNIRKWTDGEPKSHKMYFILDTEKASQERSQIKNHGFHSLHQSVASVFPVLSMLDTLNKQAPDEEAVPLWQYADALALVKNTYDAEELTTLLGTYTEKFNQKRGIRSRSEEFTKDPIGQIKLLIQYSLDQFDPARYTVRAHRHEINDAYRKQYEEHIAKHFVTTRGRSGRVLVLNQDYLLLLTNLCIGRKQQLRFQELLKEFRARGVYFDRQSEQALITFFERVGNVDRTSDSGDAVYVRSTI